MFIRNLLTTVAGCALLALAFVGFVVPILPGFLFLILALLCFASVSPALGRRLNRHDTWRAWHGKWRRGSGLPFADRLRMMFWMSADATVRVAQSRRPH